MITTAHIGLSYKCNMKCKHCFVSKELKDDVLYSHYKEVIQKLYDQGLYMVFYTYGEPLFTERFFEVAEYVASKDLCQVLMTNGFLINDETVARIKKSGINLVYVSIDSSDANKHDNNRNRKGAWERAIKAIEFLVNSGIRTGIACTVTNDNYEEIDEIYHIGENLGVDYISFLRCRHEGKLVDFDDNEKYQNQIYKMMLSHMNNKLDIKIHDPLLLPMIEEMYKESKINEIEYVKYVSMCQCHKKNNINIAPNGDIYRCDFAMESEGNIEDENIKLTDEKCSCM